MIDTVYSVLAPLVKRFEGLHKISATVPQVTVVPYLCPARILTIGYGHTRGVKSGMVITEQEANDLLIADLSESVAHTLTLCPALITAPAAHLAAIADFTFNLGAGQLRASTLRKRINAGEWDEVPYELRRWVYGGGRKLPGLIARREAEVTLIERPDE